MRRVMAAVLVIAVLTSACASAGRTPVATGPKPGVVDTGAMADYVQRLRTGSKVRVEQTNGTQLRGTLMKATADAVLLQKSTRIPEAPVEVPLAEIARVTVDGGGGMSTGKAIALGIASGAGVFLAIIGILAATFSD
jgi:hypothetical protein